MTPSRSLEPFLLLLLASCLGQADPDPSTEVRATAPVRTPPATPKSGAQIAEYVVAAFEDTRGVLWFGTMNRGVARYDGRELTYLTEADGMCGETIASIAEDADGALWFAGHTGVCKYDGTFTRTFDTEASVRTDRSGNIWVSSLDGVYRHDGDAFIAFDVPLPAQLPAAYSIRPGRVSFLLEDRRGHLWFGTDGHGAFRYDPSPGGTTSSGAFTRFTKEDGLCSNTVWNILEDRHGRIWFACIQAFQPEASGDGGVCRYDGKRFTTFPDVAGASANDVYTIHEERSGKIWIGATGVGAYRFDEEEVTLFAETDRPDLTVRFGLQAMLEARDGTLWCGFSGGLFRFDGSTFVNVTEAGPWGSSTTSGR